MMTNVLAKDIGAWVILCLGGLGFPGLASASRITSFRCGHAQNASQRVREAHQPNNRRGCGAVRLKNSRLGDQLRGLQRTIYDLADEMPTSRKTTHPYSELGPQFWCKSLTSSMSANNGVPRRLDYAGLDGQMQELQPRTRLNIASKVTALNVPTN